MNQYLPRVVILGLLASAATALAQTDLSYLFTSRPKNWFSASINIRSGGGAVHFGHLGALERFVFNPSTSSFGYDDGTVGVDTKTAGDSAPTNVFNSDNTRYQTFATNSAGVKFETGDFVAYQTNQTRIYTIDTPDQVQNGIVNYHLHGATDEGAEWDKSGKSSGGFDLQAGHDLGLIGKNGAWGFAFSLGINDINAKVSQTVTSRYYTILYQYQTSGPLNQPPAGTNPTPYYSGPTFLPISDPSGNQITANGIETTVPISQNPLPLLNPSDPTSNTTFVDHGAQVSGTWKVKGAYYFMRLGPSIRFYINKRFSVSGNAGIGGAYVGSDFSINETLVAPVLTVTPQNILTQHNRAFKLGPYAEVNFEYWVTGRTGFFAGLVYEHLGKYVQTLDSATADVNIGSGTNFRFGLITRF